MSGQIWNPPPKGAKKDLPGIPIAASQNIKEEREDAPPPKPAPEPRHETKETRKQISGGKAPSLRPGDRHVPRPENTWDSRTARSTGRVGPINTNILPELRLWFKYKAHEEGKDLCEVLEEMILARYGEPDWPREK